LTTSIGFPARNRPIVWDCAIGVVKTEEIGPIVGEKTKLAGDLRELIEVDQQPECIVAKTMSARPMAPVHHRSDVNRRAECHAGNSDAPALIWRAASAMRLDSSGTPAPIINSVYSET
jgi:hypothetical protein